MGALIPLKAPLKVFNNIMNYLEDLKSETWLPIEGWQVSNIWTYEQN